MTPHTTTEREKPWVHEMVLVHRVFRKELGMLPALVAAAPLGDRRRARVLGEHYRFVTGVLHTHHTFEDEHFWPVLHERCPLDAELVSRMESQHERIDAVMRDLAPAWRAWEQRADADTRARLAEQLAALSAALEEHLHDEEVFLLPIMADHLSVDEWAAFGKHAAKKMDKRKALFWVGLSFAEMDDEERAGMWGALPGWGRWLYRLAGPRSYRRNLARVRGTAC